MQQRVIINSNKFKLGNLVGVLLLLSFVFSLISCSGIKTRRDLEEGVSAEETESVESIKVEPPTVPKVVQRPKVGLILGPGGVKSFAHTGVIKELIKAKIPINNIVGIEWGAIVAALYAQKGQIHEAEWNLYKLEQKDFFTKSVWGSRFEAEPIEKFSKDMSGRLSVKNIDEFSIPFSCPSLSIWSGRVVWQQKGLVDTAFSRCVPYPPFFKPQAPWVAANFALADSIDHLKSQGMDLIIFVNVLSFGDLFDNEWSSEHYQEAILWKELQKYIQKYKGLSGEFIEVNTRKFKVMDFESRRALVKAGEQAGRKAANKLLDKYGF